MPSATGPQQRRSKDEPGLRKLSQWNKRPAQSIGRVMGKRQDNNTQGLDCWYWQVLYKKKHQHIELPTKS